MPRRKSQLHRRNHASMGRSERGIGVPVALPPIQKTTRRSVRGILNDLVGQHSTEIAMRLREGMTSRNLRLALKYIGMAAAYVDGKPVETHRMVGLNEAAGVGTYDMTKLTPADKKALLALLKRCKDDTKPKGTT